MALLRDDGRYVGDSVYTSGETNYEDKATFAFAADLLADHFGGGARMPGLSSSTSGAPPGRFREPLHGDSLAPSSWASISRRSSSRLQQRRGRPSVSATYVSSFQSDSSTR